MSLYQELVDAGVDRDSEIDNHEFVCQDNFRMDDIDFIEHLHNLLRKTCQEASTEDLKLLAVTTDEPTLAAIAREELIQRWRA